MAEVRFSRLTLFERLLALVTSVRPGEGRSVFYLLVQVYLLLFGYYLIRPLRETLILTEGSPEIRAYATGAIAMVLIFLIPLYKILYDYLDGNGDKTVMLRWVTGFFLSNLLLFAFLVWLDIPVAVPFYIWVGIFSVMVVAQFWAFAADLFNIKTGQRLFAVIMIGAALGAISGSQLSGRFQTWFGISNLMLLAALMLVCVIAIGRHAERHVPPGSRSNSPSRPHHSRSGLSDFLGGFNVVARSRYLMLIAVFILLLNWIHSTGGYILASFLDRHAIDTVAAQAGAITRGQIIGRFYGDYFAWIAGLQLLIQLFLVSRIFRWVGVRGAILVLPLLMIFNYGLIAMVPVFALVRLMMILETSTNISIHSTTNHALYLPVSREEKYVGKTTIDTFFMRFGDLIYAGVIFLTAQVMALEVRWIVYLNVVLALVLLWVGTAIGRHHRGQIRQNLGNLPPVVHAPLPNVYVPAGQMLLFSVPDEAFFDPDPGDTLNYRAETAGGKPLYPWIRFDAHNQTFTVRPPAGSSGSVTVELEATDFEGLSVRAAFRIEYGPDPVPRFSTPGASTRRGLPRHESGGDGDRDGADPDPAPR